MKIEFVQEEKLSGDLIYFTNINGYFASNSLSYDKEKAYKLYQNIISNKGKIDFTTVLETTEIEVDAKK